MKRIPSILAMLPFICVLFVMHAGAAEPGVELTAAERAYLDRLGPVSLCVDPDWTPFEHISPEGRHEGIAADLIALVARRSGVEIRLLPVQTWDESLAASRSGQCKLMSFLNQTPERDQWLVFTRPLFLDPNVIITQEQHPDVTELSDFEGRSIALPAGTMVMERIRRDYPGLRVIPTVSEEQAINLVSNRVADMTVRSLIVAAYTIKKEGLFNLKIAGRIPHYDNILRIGVDRNEPMLRDILDKGVATLTQDERDAISNRHAAVKLVTRVDYRLMWEVLGGAALILLLLVYRHRSQRQLDAANLALSEQRVASERLAREQQGRMIAMLSHEMKTPIAIIDGAAQSLNYLIDVARPEVALRLQRVRQGVKRLENLCDCFLHKDQLDDASLKINRRNTDLGVLAQDLVAEIDWAGRVVVDVPVPVVVLVDANLIRIAMQNLLVNALNYSSVEKPVTLSIRVDEQAVNIWVKDEGGGIPPELRADIFNCYVRGNHSTNIPGAGLGLYLVRKIVELHGGQVALADTCVGAEFNLTLPADA